MTTTQKPEPLTALQVIDRVIDMTVQHGGCPLDVVEIHYPDLLALREEIRRQAAT